MIVSKVEKIVCHSDELLALKFKDNKDVFMLSTIYYSMVNRPDRRHRNQCHTKPTRISDYKAWVGPTAPMSSRNPMRYLSNPWPYKMKCHLHFIKHSMLNSFIIYQNNGGRRALRWLQREVIAALLFENGNGSQRGEHCEAYWASLRLTNSCNRIEMKSHQIEMKATKKELARTVATIVSTVRVLSLIHIWRCRRS